MTKVREADSCNESWEVKKGDREVAFNRSAKADPAAKSWKKPVEEVKTKEPQKEIFVVRSS